MNFSLLLTISFVFSFYLCYCLQNALQKSVNANFNQKISFDRRSQCYLDYISELTLPKTQILISSEKMLSQNFVIKVLKSLHSQGEYWISVCTIESKKCDISGLNNDEISYIILSDSDDMLQTLFDTDNKVLTMTDSPVNIFVSPNVNITQTLLLVDKKYLYNAVVAEYNNENDSLTLWRSEARCKSPLADRLNFLFSCHLKQLIGYVDITDIDLRQCHWRIGVREKLPFMAQYTEDGKRSKYLGKYEFVGIENSFLFEVIGDLSKVEYIQGNSSELINMLKSRELDMMIGALPAISDVSFIEALYPHMHAKLIAVVKRRYPNQTLQLSNVLSIDFWISLILFSFFLIVIMYFCIWYNEHKRPDLCGIILYFFGISVGRAQPEKYRTFRLLWLLWVWVSFFARCAIEILLIILLAESDDVPQIKYLAELCDGNPRVYTTEDYRPYFRGGIQLAECTIEDENVFYLENPVLVLDESRLEDKDAIFMFEDEFKELATRDVKDFSKLPFWTIPEPLLHAPLSYYFHDGDPLADVYNKRAEFLKSRGLLKFYEREATRTVNFKYLKLFGYSVLYSEKSNIISLNQMYAFIVQWTQGVLASILVFIMEIIVDKLSIK